MAKRIIDLLTFLSIFGFCSALSANDSYNTGYPSSFIGSATLAANATGSIEITHNSARHTIFTNGAGNYSFTLNTATATVYVASQTALWEEHSATDTIHLEPMAIGKGTFLWIKNGSVAQRVTIKSYGR